MQYSESVIKFAQAIAKNEGFGIPGAVPTVANNPLDLTFSFGFPTNGFANKEHVLIFRSLDDGWSAGFEQVSLILTGRSKHYNLTTTLTTFGLIWSGGDPNAGKNIAAILGIPENTNMQQLADMNWESAT